VENLGFNEYQQTHNNKKFITFIGGGGIEPPISHLGTPVFIY